MKIVGLAKKGYDIVKEEFTSNPNRRRKMRQAAASAAQPKEVSLRTDIVVVPKTHSAWSKKWEAFKDKMHGHPVYTKKPGDYGGHAGEHWETSVHPVVHKIQDLNETVFGESAAAFSFKEIRRIDPSFSLPEFVAEVQEMITLTAYFKCDVEKLKQHCCSELIERCHEERKAYATVHNTWAMHPVDSQELGGAVYPTWKLREMQQLGIQALV